MHTTINDEEALERARKGKTQGLAMALAEKFTNGMLDMARESGIVPNPQLAEMCGAFAARCVDVVMAELAVVQTKMTVTPDSVPPELRTAVTQDIIDHFVKPAMATQIADAIMSSGLAMPTLAIPPSMGAMPVFASWAYALRPQSGPVGMPNAPRLDYGKGTSVFPRAMVPAAKGSAEAKQPSRILLPGLGS